MSDQEWTIADIPSARLAALKEWLALKASEAARARTSHLAADALARAKDGSHWPVHMKATESILPDRASMALPINGVHVMPVFGKGEDTFPYLGDTDSVTEYADSIDADIWVYIAEHTMSDRFIARVMHTMRNEAINRGRIVDWSKRDDVASEARMIATKIMRDLLTRDDVTRVRDLVRLDKLAGVTEFDIPRLKRCGACVGCIQAREAGSASRASRWDIRSCTKPMITVDAITPDRILTRAIWRAASDVTLSTSAVAATKAKYFVPKLIADAVIAEREEADTSPVNLRNVPNGAADLVRVLASALEAIGEDATSGPGGLSPIAGSILARIMGTTDSPRGIRTALDHAQSALWPESFGTRQDAAERERTRKREAARTRRTTERHAREHIDAPDPACPVCVPVEAVATP